MKRMLFSLMWAFIMVGVLLHPGCKKSDSSPYSMIYHKWEWVESIGGLGGWVRTPESEGYTQSIEFDENGFYTKYKNNVVDRRGTYTIIRAESQLDQKEYDMVVFDDGSPTQAIMILTDNQLTLREECFDCFTHTYRR